MHWKIGTLSFVASAMIALVGCQPIQAPSPEQGQPVGEGLQGTVWLLDELAGEPALADAAVTAQFGADGTLSGEAGCNSYSTSYTIEGSNITIDPQIASTMMACDEAIMDQESVYLAGLPTVVSYELAGETLNLLNDNGENFAAYHAQSQTVADSAWDVISFNNGQEAVVSVLVDTPLTLTFAADGTLEGSAGCNTYGGPYTVDGDQITIGPLASTMMACAEEIMDQESQYLAALESAAVYSVSGAQLEMRTADGALAVTAQRAD